MLVFSQVRRSTWDCRTAQRSMVRRRSTVRFRKGAPCDVARHRNDPEPTLGFGVFASAGGSGWAANGLVVAGGVEGEFAEEFAGSGVDDADVQVVDEQQDVGSGVGPAGADVVEAAVDAQGDTSVGVEPVGADAVVGVGGPVAGGGFGARLVGGGRGGPVRQGAVWPLVVVDGGEGIQAGRVCAGRVQRSECRARRCLREQRRGLAAPGAATAVGWRGSRGCRWR
jgi:hypothetical protein